MARRRCRRTPISMKTRFPELMHIPLNQVEQKAWLEFKKLDDGHPPMLEYLSPELLNEVKRPINLDHPFVHVIADFAVASFNNIIQMYIKKDVHNNLHDYEVMECDYIHVFHRFYRFYMTIEAIEEGILGVYRTEVSCHPIDGCKTMTKFFLTDHIPTGKIAKALPRLISLKYQYKTLKGMRRDLEIKLGATHKSVKGKNEVEVKAELIRLKELHKAMKGVCNVLYWNIRSKIPKTWNETSNTEDWSVSLFPRYLLAERNDNATCKGYNFNNQSRLT
uniref:uncharacterized protein LOC122594097 n=1 Tax=Erigeron canadensis TaxID=72917 RepID=UPI001CB89240|nr:uncharacterized protein LOC122594097 [Erigeron canadensis]